MDGGVEIEKVIMAVAVFVVVVEEDTVFDREPVLELRGEVDAEAATLPEAVKKGDIDPLGKEEGEFDIC